MFAHRRVLAIALAVVGLLILAVVIGASVVDEPLRRYAEDKANSLLPGYRITIGAVDLHPFTLSVDVEDLVVRQDIHPDPPVLSIPRVTADARLAPLFAGRVGADVRVETPVFSLNRKHVDGFFRRTDKEDVKEEAQLWQHRVRDMVAFRAALHVDGGHLTYDEGQPASQPLRVERIDVDALDITNRPEEGSEHPSTVRVSAVLPDQSQVALDGRADWLAVPVPKLAADVKVERLQIRNLLPVAGHYNVQCRQGALDLNGRLLYSKESTVMAIEDMRLEGAKIDYVHSAATKPKEVQQAKKVAEKVGDAHRDQSVQVKVEHGKIVNSEIGFVNKATSPDYRVFISDMDVDLQNFSNRLEEGTGVVKVTGKFMGSGRTEVNGTFRPEKPKPDFNLGVKIVKTKVNAFNDVLRAHGDLDTHQGTFAFFSELSVKNNQISGYVKPLLKDVEVYDPKQDENKALTQKVYEAVVGGVLGLLENKARDEAATVTDMSGPIENPQANTWQIVQKLVQNAFFKAILPGFQEIG